MLFCVPHLSRPPHQTTRCMLRGGGLRQHLVRSLRSSPAPALSTTLLHILLSRERGRETLPRHVYTTVSLGLCMFNFTPNIHLCVQPSPATGGGRPSFQHPPNLPPPYFPSSRDHISSVGCAGAHGSSSSPSSPRLFFPTCIAFCEIPCSVNPIVTLKAGSIDDLAQARW